MDVSQNIIYRIPQMANLRRIIMINQKLLPAVTRAFAISIWGLGLEVFTRYNQLQLGLFPGFHAVPWLCGAIVHLMKMLKRTATSLGDLMSGKSFYVHIPVEERYISLSVEQFAYIYCGERFRRETSYLSNVEDVPNRSQPPGSPELRLGLVLPTLGRQFHLCLRLPLGCCFPCQNPKSFEV